MDSVNCPKRWQLSNGGSECAPNVSNVYTKPPDTYFQRWHVELRQPDKKEKIEVPELSKPTLNRQSKCKFASQVVCVRQSCTDIGKVSVPISPAVWQLSTLFAVQTVTLSNWLQVEICSSRVKLQIYSMHYDTVTWLGKLRKLITSWKWIN